MIFVGSGRPEGPHDQDPLEELVEPEEPVVGVVEDPLVVLVEPDEVVDGVVQDPPQDPLVDPEEPVVEDVWFQLPLGKLGKPVRGVVKCHDEEDESWELV